MFIAMNRFKVRKGSEHDFEQVWLTRQSHLEEVPGFVVFHLLKGPEKDDHVLYASHSEWRSEKHFEAWTRSEAFRKAHASAGAGKPLYLGHPEFEGFTVLQEVKADGLGKRRRRVTAPVTPLRGLGKGRGQDQAARSSCARTPASLRGWQRERFGRTPEAQSSWRGHRPWRG